MPNRSDSVIILAGGKGTRLLQPETEVSSLLLITSIAAAFSSFSQVLKASW